MGLISKIIEAPQKGYSKPEIIRSLGIFCEIFEDKLIDFLPKIIQILLECLQEEDLELHEPIRDSFGKIAKHILSNIPLPEAGKETHVLLRNLWNLCGDASRHTQIGSALCISKILQGVRGEILHDSVERISLKLTELLEKPECKATLQLLECIMSLLVSVDDNASQLENSAKIVLPSVVQNISNSEWNVRKLALEIIYLLTALAGETLEVYRDDLIEIVEQSRYDKVSLWLSEHNFLNLQKRSKAFKKWQSLLQMDSKTFEMFHKKNLVSFAEPLAQDSKTVQVSDSSTSLEN